VSLLQSQISELTSRVCEVSASYGVWHLLVHPEARAPYEKMLVEHSEFFMLTAASHFQSVAVGVYQLTDRRDDSLSVCSLCRDIAAFRPDLTREVQRSLLPSTELFERLACLRHKVYAHRDASTSPEMIFLEVSLTPEQIGSCVSLLQDALETLSRAISPAPPFGSVVLESTKAADRARDALMRLLRVL
jgi:hypothetical protein